MFLLVFARWRVGSRPRIRTICSPGTSSQPSKYKVSLWELQVPGNCASASSLLLSWQFATDHIVRGAHYRIGVARVFTADGPIDWTTFHGRSLYNLVVFDLVKLGKGSQWINTDAEDPAITLIFSDSIRWGFNAPVARPKSVSLTWPVPSIKKF